ncbi:acyltransferase family protein [Aeromicrobium choanae]|uniref:Peptidoglycan/LPS O-acetylase OafA/YrhL, contains acyltransferase and SGNH-hydrolase domains n=1 Tax=Aeromicrobium choanae TaxID=1736691 RepID=A0A1T4YN07_9ACTN|nr:acyltransferase family protein [Aeromicrobium choanae]SKB03146.1 Peptidoglycan/LPS O-acetylase OafA/YrhL, contains acyltransferase and SGNH-hydrolase domains [Aeromicrobium choanae]
MGVTATPVRRRVASLDGIRGGFMALFMAYHFGLTALTGAWTGINVFFVLSGFLIARLLITERERFGRVDLLGFYRRRARRLLPALVVLLLVVATWALLLADDATRRQLRGDIVATLGFVMNWRLIAEADQYFAEFGSASMLRHAWTLSVEEQFYVVVPLLLAALAWIGSRRVAIAVLALLAVGSAWWTAQVGLDGASAQAHAYYGTDTRLQSLLVGVLLAHLLAGPAALRTPSRAVLEPVSWLSLGALLAALVLVDPMSPLFFEQGGMLVQSAVVAVLVWACVARPDLSVHRVLGWRPLAYLGERSYGLYLYHWPVKLWLEREVPGMSAAVEIAVGCVVTTALAALSYRYLERPVLDHGLRGLVPRLRRPGWLAVAGPAAVVVMAVVVGQVPATGETVARPDIPSLKADQPVYEAADETTRVAMFGDSLPDRLAEVFPQEQYEDLSVVSLAVPGCDLLESRIAYRELQQDEPCRAAKRDFAANLRESGADTALVMLPTFAAIPHEDPDGNPIWLDSPRFRREVIEALDRLRDDASEAQVGLQVATLPCRDPRQMATIPGIAAYVADHPEVIDATAEPTVVNEWVRAWARSRSVPLVDVYEALGCGDGPVREVNGITLFSDGLHFDDEAAAMVWTWLAPLVRDQAGEAAR